MLKFVSDDGIVTFVSRCMGIEINVYDLSFIRMWIDLVRIFISA